MTTDNSTSIPADLAEKLEQLSRKYAAMGQDMASYLEGLLQADYLTYWDYIHLETLLSLQNPRTAYPDELIFITYHQITELYFKLVKHEIAQIADCVPEGASAGFSEFFTQRVARINRYFDMLENSFTVMVEGMDKEQFLKFRMALLPSSGFQSVQFREIEIMATDFALLLDDPQGEVTDEPVSRQYDRIYWKRGATELSSQQKTLTLRQFEAQYSDRLIRLATDYQTKNLRQAMLLLQRSGLLTDELKAGLRAFDQRVNVRWKLMHLRSAVRYLHKSPEAIEATGGTNWQRYLPPAGQKRVFFPELWEAAELDQWGTMR